MRCPLATILSMNAKIEKCVWTAPACTDCMWEHSLERLRRCQNWIKTVTLWRTIFLQPKHIIFPKIDSKRYPKGWLYFGGGASWEALGAPLVLQALPWRPKWALYTLRSAPKARKVMTKWYPAINTDTQNAPETAFTSVPTWTLELENWPGGLREAIG